MNAMGNERLKLAVLGCGAVTEEFHLPAAQKSEHVTVTMLVDKDVHRAQLLARKFDVPMTTDDWATIDDHAEAVLIALPHHLHARATIEMLGRGLHALVEKPMALRGDECDAMVAQARKGGLVLAVGLVRRFYPSFQFAKHALEDGVIGNVTDFDYREGRIYDWPLKSGFRFQKDTAGGGVLIDTGSHVTDALLWWLGDWDSVECYDDAEGGVEANCELHLRLRNGSSGIVDLSRTRNLRNSCILRGDRGVLEIGAGANSTVRLQVGRQKVVLDGQAVRQGIGKENLQDALRRQLDDFAAAVLHGQTPLVPGEQGSRSVRLIEACYAGRKPMRMPWDL